MAPPPEQNGKAEDGCSDDCANQDRIGMTEGDQAERQPGHTAEAEPQQQPGTTARHNPGRAKSDSAVEMTMTSWIA